MVGEKWYGVSHYGWGKFSDLQSSDYWKNAFVKLSLPPGRNLIISPHIEQPPISFPKNGRSPHEKHF